MRLILVLIICAYCATSTLAQRQGPQYCYTPENYYGSCVTLSYCPQVVNIFRAQNQQSAQRYVIALQRACGVRSVNNDPVVCCTRPSTRPVAPQPQPVTQAPINPFLPVNTNSPFVQPTTNSNPFLNPSTTTTTRRTTTTTRATTTQTSQPLIDNRRYCRGPDTREGYCIDLIQCESLIEELQRRAEDPTFKNFLLASRTICGGVGTSVCCPSASNGGGNEDLSTRNTNDGIPKVVPTLEDGCGYTLNSFKKIVGGEASKIGAWPWVALLGYSNEPVTSKFKCGGTLVTAKHVVTAAHCIRKDLSVVRLGEHDLTKDSEAAHIDIPVIKTAVHPQYSKTNGRGDIALVYLANTVRFTDFIKPICLPTSSQLRKKSYVSFTPFVVGWGKTMEGGQSANVLQELQIPIFDNQVCRTNYAKENRLVNDQQFDAAVICAGVLSGGKDTCQGDSGGPLMIPEPYKDNVRYYLIGVVSYGIGCARPNVPGVYSSTQYFMDWILEELAKP